MFNSLFTKVTNGNYSTRLPKNNFWLFQIYYEIRIKTHSEVDTFVSGLLHAEVHGRVREVVDGAQRVAGRLQDRHDLGRVGGEGEQGRQQRAEHEQPHGPQPRREIRTWAQIIKYI